MKSMHFKIYFIFFIVVAFCITDISVQYSYGYELLGGSDDNLKEKIPVLFNEFENKISQLDTKIDDRLSFGMNLATGMVTILSMCLILIPVISYSASKTEFEKGKKMFEDYFKESKDKIESDKNDISKIITESRTELAKIKKEYNDELDAVKIEIEENRKEIENNNNKIKNIELEAEHSRKNIVKAEQEWEKALFKINDIYKNINIGSSLSENVMFVANNAVDKNVHTETLIALAFQSHNDKQWNDAFVYWKNIIKRTPDDKKALSFFVYSGLKLFISHNKNEYFRYILESIEPHIDSIKDQSFALSTTALYYSLCYELKNTDKEFYYDNADRDFSIATRFEPLQDEYWLNWGSLIIRKALSQSLVHEKRTLLESALLKLNKAYEIKNDSSIILMKLSEVNLYMSDAYETFSEKYTYLDKSEDYINKSLTILEDAANHNILGKVFLKRSLLSSDEHDKFSLLNKARNSFVKSTSMNKTYLDAIANFAAVSFMLYQSPQSIEKKEYLHDSQNAFATLKTFCPNEVFIYFGLAKVEFASNNNEIGLKYLKKCLEMNFEYTKKMLYLDEYLKSLNIVELEDVFNNNKDFC